MTRPGIWLGDALRGLEVARDDGERARVLHMLGFTGPAAIRADDDIPVRPRPPRPHPVSADERPEDRAEEVAPDAFPLPHTPAQRTGPSQATAELPLLRPVRTEPLAATRAPDEPLARPGAEEARGPVGPHLPLLTPASAGVVIRAALSQRVAEGPVDIAALLDTLAHGHPVTRLPRRPVRTLRFGVQVLVDRGPAMQPFRRDQNHLVTQIRSVVGTGLVQVRYFSGLPQSGTGTGARHTRGPYEPPEAGRRILLLSDLGTGGPANGGGYGHRAGWEEFVGTVRRAGCVPVALLPSPPSRWPEWATRLLPLVSWDRATTVGWVWARMP